MLLFSNKKIETEKEKTGRGLSAKRRRPCRHSPSPGAMAWASPCRLPLLLLAAAPPLSSSRISEHCTVLCFPLSPSPCSRETLVLPAELLPVRLRPPRLPVVPAVPEPNGAHHHLRLDLLPLPTGGIGPGSPGTDGRIHAFSPDRGRRAPSTTVPSPALLRPHRPLHIAQGEHPVLVRLSFFLLPLCNLARIIDHRGLPPSSTPASRR